MRSTSHLQHYTNDRYLSSGCSWRDSIAGIDERGPNLQSIESGGAEVMPVLVSIKHFLMLSRTVRWI